MVSTLCLQNVLLDENEKYSLKQWYATSRSGSSIRLLVFSDSAVFDKVSTAIINYGGHAQQAIKMSRVLSHSATVWNNNIHTFQ